MLRGFPGSVFRVNTDLFIISSDEAPAIITQSLFNYPFYASRDLYYVENCHLLFQHQTRVLSLQHLQRCACAFHAN